MRHLPQSVSETFAGFRALKTIYFPHGVTPKHQAGFYVARIAQRVVPDHLVETQDEWVPRLASQCRNLQDITVEWERGGLMNRNTYHVMRNERGKALKIALVQKHGLALPE